LFVLEDNEIEMPISIALDTNYLKPEIVPEEINAQKPVVDFLHNVLHSRTGAGNDYLGWLEPWKMMPVGEVERIKAAANKLRECTDVLVVIGIGGSYLGARAVIEALGADEKERVLFAGQNISAAYHKELIEKLRGRKFAINVISKSGTTTEPAIAFRIIRKMLEDEVGAAEASKLIIATTDSEKGALRKLACENGYETFTVPADVGGRFSVLSAVGLLPIAYAGIDVNELISGASACAEVLEDSDIEANTAYRYAAIRNRLYAKGFGIEILASFEPRLHYLAEWWKQLYGESEGKQGMGIFPASVDFTTDLHSLGQWIQQGRRVVFETFIDVEYGEAEVVVPKASDDGDGLSYLEGKSLHDINREAYKATALAHREGGVPNMTLRVPRLDARVFGELIYFFEKACAMSGYLMGVNPFDQPGVEAYKRHMFTLLGKLGY